jgi:RNA polymerase sigma factor (sigma-70 family)
MARVASGDSQAFEEIFDRYGPGLLSFCSHMLGSREWGEDALQLTLVAAYKALRRGACDGALRPWLYAIARNRCVSELRARREIPDSDCVSADRPASNGPASLFERREQLREVLQDIQRLPPDQRAALVLFELGDQSHEEIASVLGVRRDKVKALIFQAREGLSRGRSARESACSEVREQLANARGKAPARGIVRAHIDRCAACQEFEREAGRQRAALALILPVALSGQLKVAVLAATLEHGGAGASAAGVTGSGAAGSLTGASVGGSGSGVVAAAGGGGAPTLAASTLGTEAVAGVGALTSSVPVATVAKLATVVVAAVGVGGVAGGAPMPSPRPHVQVLAGRPAQPAPSRPVSGPPASGVTRSQPGTLPATSQSVVGVPVPGGPSATGAPSPPVPSALAAPSSSVSPAAETAPGTAGGGGPASPVGTPSAPGASAPGNVSATSTAPSSGSSTTTVAATTPGSSSAGSDVSTSSTTTTASSETTPPPAPPSDPSASQGGSGGSSGVAGNVPGGSAGAGRPSDGSDSGTSAPGSNGNGPPITPPGCVRNPAPGCAKHTPHS